VKADSVVSRRVVPFQGVGQATKRKRRKSRVLEVAYKGLSQGETTAKNTVAMY
jgi:hypothetical protein